MDRNARVGRLEAEDRHAVEEDRERAQEGDAPRPAMDARDAGSALGQEVELPVDPRRGRDLHERQGEAAVANQAFIAIVEEKTVVTSSV